MDWHSTLKALHPKAQGSMYSSNPGPRGDIGNPTPKGLHQGATLDVHSHDATPSGNAVNDFPRPEGPILPAQAAGLGKIVRGQYVGPEGAVRLALVGCEPPFQGEMVFRVPFPRPSAWADRIGPSGRNAKCKSFTALPFGVEFSMSPRDPGFDEYIESWALGCNAFSVECQSIGGVACST